MISRLVFDATDADTIADSHNVGAYLRSADGTLLTHTTVGGKEALDVNIVEGINVEVDLSHVDDSVRLGDGTDFFTSTTVGADIGLDVNLINASIVVTATDLDIRDLDSAQDSIQSNTHDGAGNAIGSTGGSLHVSVQDAFDPALAVTAIATNANILASANTAQDVVASPLADRKYLMIYNNDNRIAYIGESGVSAADGFPLPQNSVLSLRVGDAVDIEWVSGKTSHDIRTLELS